MKIKIIASIVLCFLSSFAFAENPYCKLQNKYRLFLVGMDPAHPDRYPMAEMLSRGAHAKEVSVGIDSAVGMPSLLNNSDMLVLENPMVRGFGLTLKAYWEVESRLFRHDGGFLPEIQGPQLNEAVLNFANELTQNIELQKVWQSAISDLAFAQSQHTKVGVVLKAFDSRKYGARLGFLINNREVLAALNTIMKPVMRKYLSTVSERLSADKSIPAPSDLSRMSELLDFQQFSKSDKLYPVLVRWYFMLGQQFVGKFNNDWRALAMSHQVLKNLCAGERAQDSRTKQIVITELDNVVPMDRQLKDLADDNLTLTIEVPPRIGSEFEKIVNDFVVRFSN